MRLDRIIRILCSLTNLGSDTLAAFSRAAPCAFWNGINGHVNAMNVETTVTAVTEEHGVVCAGMDLGADGAFGFKKSRGSRRGCHPRRVDDGASHVHGLEGGKVRELGTKGLGLLDNGTVGALDLAVLMRLTTLNEAEGDTEDVAQDL